MGWVEEMSPKRRTTSTPKTGEAGFAEALDKTFGKGFSKMAAEAFENEDDVVTECSCGCGCQFIGHDGSMITCLKHQSEGEKKLRTKALNEPQFE
jgi:hypothetical protein